MFIISYSLMFYIIYLNIIIDEGIINYLLFVLRHIETFIIFPTIYLLYRALQSKI